MKAKTKAKAKTIDQYLATLSGDKRAALETLRKTIQAALPRAEECISYQIPAFRLDGKVLVWFGAGANHCAFYPGAVVEAFADHPLPATLVRKLLKARIARRG